jgi:formylglycine-generating enzyme required for sulfatase activity
MKNRIMISTTLAIVLTAVMILSGASVTVVHAQTQPATNPATDPESVLWAEATRMGNSEAYLFFLEKFPNGKFSTEAKRRLMGIEEDRIALPRWREAQSVNTREAFVRFLTDGVTGKYVAEAFARIAELDRQDLDRAWGEAERANSIEAYQGFLNSHPGSRYDNIARLRLRVMGGEAVAARPPMGTVGTTRINDIGMQMIWIPSGSFMMGSPASEAHRDSDEGPQRLVTIRQGFWMGRYEVTQEQYEAVMGTNPSRFTTCGKDCPLENISWNDAKEFISKLNARNDGFVYSLPSEAEWEYAARAGTTTAFAFGNSLSSTQANFDGNRPYGNAPKGPFLRSTRTVGSYRPNAWGLYDMHGNVFEWVEDIFEDSYTGLPTDGSANTTRGDSSFRVLRGGSWYDGGFLTRSAIRFWNDPAVRSSRYGFRVVARAKNQ